MKLSFLQGLALALLVSAVARPAHAQLGVAVGLNFNRLSDIQMNSTEATFENRQGWNAALWFDLPLGPVALRPEVRYMNAGALYDGLGNGPDAADFDVNLIEVPLSVRFRLGTPLVAPYVAAGPVLRFPSSSDDEGHEALKSMSFAGGLGVGLEVKLAGLRLYPELAYTFGVTSFTEKSFQVGGTTFTPDEDQRLNAVMLRLGVGF